MTLFLPTFGLFARQRAAEAENKALLEKNDRLNGIASRLASERDRLTAEVDYQRARAEAFESACRRQEEEIARLRAHHAADAAQTTGEST